MKCEMILDKAFEIIEDPSSECKIIIPKETSTALFLKFTENYQGKLEIVVEENAALNLCSWNESQNCDITYEIDVQKDANLKASFGEMSEGNLNCTQHVYLTGEGASAQIDTASLVKGKLVFDLACIHKAPHTSANMHNYAVIHENAHYEMSDNGKINKGCYGSESHQTSRVLTLSKKQTSKVTPLLLIDENDVQASHATTMGQIDENQLYYLQTRGLTKQQALGLITVGYLMPIASVLDDEEVQKELTEKIEKKVGLA